MDCQLGSEYVKKIGGNVMANFFCVYCGQKFSSVQQLVNSNCAKHPNGTFKGKHQLYEGGEKSQYTCKYCGNKFSSLQQLTSANCAKHPNGTFKGKHSPAL